MGNSASVPEEKGSRSGDGRCRELSSGGSSLKRAAISGEAASDSSNRSSPPERGSRSVDGSSRKLLSSSSSRVPRKKSVVGRASNSVPEKEDTADDMNSVASVASSVINSDADIVEARDVDPEQSTEATSWESLTDDQRVEEAAKTLKTVGMGKIQDFNDKALSCMFTEGFKLLKKKNIIKSRKDAKMKRERQIKFIHAAVRFFQARMKKRREQLKMCTEASKNETYVRMNRPHE
ncbi:hypothetical protein THAOC_21064, partial [Thalassiosira oceanica]